MYKDWKIVADCIEKVRDIKAKPPFKISKGDYLNLIYIYKKLQNFNIFIQCKYVDSSRYK